MSLRVALGEDNFISRQGICRVLDGEEDLEVVAACGDLTSLRVAVDETRPDVVLSDIRMPPTHTDEGIRLAAELRRTRPEMGVVILSMYADPQYAIKLLEGSSDRRAYLLKERVQCGSDLSRVLHEVAEGGSVVDSRIVDGLLAAQRQHEESRLAVLTAREQEVVALLAEGLSNGAISERLVITKRAVERHINSIFSKLDLEDSCGSSRRVTAVLLYLAEVG